MGTGKHNRPDSVYDNIKDEDRHRNDDEDEGFEMSSRDSSSSPERAKGRQHPSISFSESTTVPQNLAFEKTVKPHRHTPTRSSLRHSRMIVMNRIHNNNVNDVVLRRDLRLIFVIFDVLKVCAGILIITIATWLIIWIPSLKTFHKPYWSGLPLIVSGMYGFIVICCFQARSDLSRRCVSNKSSEICGIILTVLCGILCSMAFVFLLLHLSTLPKLACVSPQSKNSTCYCYDNEKFNISGENAIEHENYSKYVFDLIDYVNADCVQIKDLIIILLTILTVTCAFGCLLSFIYTYFYVSHFKYQIYSKVHTINTHCYQ